MVCVCVWCVCVCVVQLSLARVFVAHRCSSLLSLFHLLQDKWSFEMLRVLFILVVCALCTRQAAKTKKQKQKTKTKQSVNRATLDWCKGWNKACTASHSQPVCRRVCVCVLACMRHGALMLLFTGSPGHQSASWRHAWT